MKTFYIFDGTSLPTPYNHRFFVEKFAAGFSSHGYDIRVVSGIEQITEDGFVMISNHPFYYGLGRLGKTVLSGLDKYEPFGVLRKAASYCHRSVITKLAKRIQDKDQALIAWFWHEDEDYFNDLGIPVIFTGEHHYGSPDSSDWHRQWFAFCRSRDNALPVRFSANIDPERVGVGCNNSRFDVSFVGNGSYKAEWYSHYRDSPTCRIVPTPPYISERERLAIYRDSRISLGLHSADNIRNKVVVERVFEALAYGALCLTDNPYAVSATDGCAILIAGRDELRQNVDLYLKDEGKRLELRSRGYVFAKSKGTYAHRAQDFISLKARLRKGCSQPAESFAG